MEAFLVVLVAMAVLGVGVIAVLGAALVVRVAAPTSGQDR